MVLAFNAPVAVLCAFLARVQDEGHSLAGCSQRNVLHAMQRVRKEVHEFQALVKKTRERSQF
jgi:lipid II:glycine glycyltransferase (peptidoglycan interpeptide bridge formation enzyme)